jgi:broad specificity phosphatase PhoE
MIYIVRHGQTDWNLEGRYQGRKDIELNNTGIEQARKICYDLKDIRFDVVFSSPLKRAYKTAEIICDNDIIMDSRIIERCNGKLEGKLKSDCKEVVNLNDPKENKYDIESLMDFRKRIKNFLDEVILKYKNKNVLIVTHAGVSIYLKCYFDGEPDDKDYSKLKLKNCEVLKYNNDNN